MTLSVVILVSMLAAPVDEADVFRTQIDGGTESGWVVTNPSGSSDFFNVRYDLGAALLSGVTIHVRNAGSASSYPRVGAYASNLTLDPTGNTPDLSSPLGETFSPSLLIGEYALPLSFAPASVVGPFHVAAQFPPGDPGLLGIGADTDNATGDGGESPGSPNPHDSSGFTSDAYATPSVFPVVFGDYGLGVQEVLDGSAAVFQLNRQHDFSDFVTGDFDEIGTLFSDAVEFFGLFISAPDHAGGNEVAMIFLSSGGVPITPIGGIIPLPNSNGTTSHIRLTALPPCLDGLTIGLMAITGTIGASGSIHLSNEVLLHTNGDSPMGNQDDGTYESGWVVSVPSGSSDYFNVNTPHWCPGDTLSTQSMAVLDFGSSVSQFPMSGLTPPNRVVDPSGNTPDLLNPYVLQPFSFPALTFCTTSGQMITHSFAPATISDANVHTVVQFPPGDPGLLGIAADTNSGSDPGGSGLTDDGYQTPSIDFAGNWGIRSY